MLIQQMSVLSVREHVHWLFKENKQTEKNTAVGVFMQINQNEVLLVVSECTSRLPIKTLIHCQWCSSRRHIVCVQVSTDLLQVTKMKSWCSSSSQKSKVIVVFLL